MPLFVTLFDILHSNYKFLFIFLILEKKKKAQANNENSSPLQDEKKSEEDSNDDYLDEEMKAEDRNCLEKISTILSDHKKDIINYIPPQSRQDMRDKRMSRVQEKLVALSSGADIANIPSTLVSCCWFLE